MGEQRLVYYTNIFVIILAMQTDDGVGYCDYLRKNDIVKWVFIILISLNS